MMTVSSDPDIRTVRTYTNYGAFTMFLRNEEEEYCCCSCNINDQIRQVREDSKSYDSRNK